MARKPTTTRLSVANLAGLGATHLAELLIEAGAGNANLKRRLKLELAAEAGPDLLANEIDKRLAALAASRARVSWRKRPELIDDLKTHHRMIVERLAVSAPQSALTALLQWFDLYAGLSARVKDPRGELRLAFEGAAPDMWRLAGVATPDDAALRPLIDALRRHPLDYARWIGAADEALSSDLARRLLDALDDDFRASLSARGLVRRLAEAAGDLDLWMSLLTPAETASPDVAADVARRLLTAGRIAEARSALEKALHRSPLDRALHRSPPVLTYGWEAASIDLLEAEGHGVEAQNLRWSLFERDLSAPALRDYLRRLPDFEDVEALDKAFSHAAAHPDFASALAFLMDWPAHREAAAMVIARRREAQKPHPQKADWAERLMQRFPDAAETLTD